MTDSASRIAALVADAVRRSARRETILGGVLAALLSLLLAIALAMLMGASKNGRWAAILCSAVPFLLLLPTAAYVVSRLRLLRRPQDTPFARLLAEPQRIERIVANHVSYRASGARLGSEHILHLESPGESAYCRLHASAFEAIMAHLSTQIPEVMARWRKELEKARLEASVR